jgi:Flp pilus assembly protein TadG
MMREKSVRRRDQRGASTLEMVLIAPVLIFALMAIVQFGLYFHAKNVAEQAAQEGAAAARSFDGTESSAQGVTEDYLAALGESTLQGRSVSVSRGLESASVTVRGTALSLIPIPGLSLHVEVTASGPVERYVPPVDD